MRILLNLHPLLTGHGTAEPGWLPWNRFLNSITAELIQSLRRGGHGFDLLVSGNVKQLAARIRESSPDAVLTNIHPVGPGDWQRVRTLRSARPWVVLPTGRFDEGSHRVALHEGLAMERLVSHLLHGGCRRIGLVAFGPMGARGEACRVALRERGLTIPPTHQFLVERREVPWATLRVELRHFLETRCGRGVSDPVDGIIAWNDTVAREVIRTARQSGIRVPEDLAVTGVDGLEDCEAQPSLTTIRFDFTETARQAVAMAVQLASGPSVAPGLLRQVPGRLRPGESTARPRGHSPRTLELETLLKRFFTHSDPAGACARAMEWTRPYFLRRYAEATGRSFHASLTARRMEMAGSLLAKGSSPRKVAEACGYLSERSFYRHRRRFGMEGDLLKADRS